MLLGWIFLFTCTTLALEIYTPFIEINEKGAEKYRDNNIVDQQEPKAHASPYSTLEAIKVVQID